MTHKILNLRSVAMLAIVTAGVLVSGQLFETSAQRDPFAKASYQKQKPEGSAAGAKKPAKTGPANPVTYGAPMIEARIEYYKQLRAQAAANGQTLPKVTSVLTLNELAVTGIFKTPRGYAAMVEATPIKLSYTIYPGEKFFDGQLVAVEENKLVFRKVTKTAPNKYVASVENKPLQQFTMKSQIEGTAASDKSSQVATAATPPVATPSAPVQQGPMISLLDEMNKAPVENEKATTKKPGKKPAKVAKSTK